MMTARALHASLRMTHHYPLRSEWQPAELGFFRSTGGAILVFICLVMAMFLLVPRTPPKKPTLVTQARMVTLPPPPPPPPQVVQPPEPLQPPPIKPPEAPVPSKIEVPKPPPRPVHHVVRRPPVHHEVPRPETPPPPPNVPVSRAPTPPAPPVQQTSGIGPYSRGLHDEIQQNVEVPPAIEQLGLSGTAVIAFTISPNGGVSNVRVARSSGNRLIDQACEDAVRHTGYRAFTSNMPTHALSFEVPIQVVPSGGG